MYAFPDMIQLSNQDWKSEAHKHVAVSLLIGNPGVFTRTALIELGGKINALSVDDVKKLTIEGAVRMGIPFNSYGGGPMNTYELHARMIKSERLANQLHAAGIGSDAAKSMTQEQWGQLAEAASVKSPSQATQEYVINLLRDREDAALALAVVNPDSWNKVGTL